MSAETLLAYVGNAAGIAFDNDSPACALIIGGHKVTFEIFEDNLFVSAEITPAGKDPMLERMLMNKNFMGLGKSGNTISIDGKNNEYILHTIFYTGTTVEEFEPRFLRFLDGVKEILKFVDSYNATMGRKNFQTLDQNNTNIRV